MAVCWDVCYQQQQGSPDNYGSVNARISVPKAEIQATIEHCLDTHQATANIIVEPTFPEAKSTMVPATLKGKTCVSILSSMKQNAAVAYYALGTIKVLISGVPRTLQHQVVEARSYNPTEGMGGHESQLGPRSQGHDCHRSAVS